MTSTKKKQSADDLDVNPRLLALRDKDALAKWLVRYYFKPEKSGEDWWTSKVNEKNVLAYVSDPSNHFPLTPREIVDDWKIKKSLKGDMAAIDDKDISDFEKPSSPESTTRTEEVPLKNISQEMDLTIPGVRNIEQQGMERMRKLFGGDPSSIDPNELDSMSAKIDEVRASTASDFAMALKSAGGNIRKFFQTAKASLGITEREMAQVQDREIEMLMFLMQQPTQAVAEYLRGDILKSNNRMKTFQMAVAHRMFPGAKRGRKPKNAK